MYGSLAFIYEVIRLTLLPDEQAAEQFIAAANAFRMQKQGMTLQTP
jgi:hypothetical protein